jgi:hypothetical protein
MGFMIKSSSATKLSTASSSSRETDSSAGESSMFLVHGPQHPTTLSEKPHGKQHQYSLGGIRRTLLRHKVPSSLTPSSSLSYFNTRRSKSTKHEICMDIIETALIEMNKHAPLPATTCAVRQQEEPKQQAQQALSSPKQQTSHRVRFAPPSEYQVIPSTLCNGLTKEDIQNSWWTSKDTANTFQELREIIGSFLASEPRTMSDFGHLLSHCHEASSDNNSLLDSNHNHTLTARDELQQGVLLILPMVEASMRGLEIDLAPGLREIRRTYQREVLKCADRLPQNLNRDLKDRMLATRSANLSRPLRMLARVMGEADAVECLANY